MLPLRSQFLLARSLLFVLSSPSVNVNTDLIMKLLIILNNAGFGFGLFWFWGFGLLFGLGLGWGFFFLVSTTLLALFLNYSPLTSQMILRLYSYALIKQQ